MLAVCLQSRWAARRVVQEGAAERRSVDVENAYMAVLLRFSVTTRRIKADSTSSTRGSSNELGLTAEATTISSVWSFARP